MQPLARNATRYVSKLSNKIRRKLHTFTLDSDLSPAQGRVLHFLLAQNGEVFQKDIEEEYSLRPSSASELLHQMEEKGFIVRIPADYDRRLKKIEVTEKGLGYKSRVFENLSGLEKELTAGISDEELSVFCSVMEKMMKNMDD
ncbi:MAG: MarR family winged helix-turn-helix transcriptional regulator [Eubacteriaceae bacterium]|jgi:DNA-binding MarR family transcriptional regulator